MFWIAEEVPQRQDWPCTGAPIAYLSRMSSAKRRTEESAFQGDLFGAPAGLPPATMPEGFSHQPELISRDEEHELVSHIQGLPFEPFDFSGFAGEGKARADLPRKKEPRANGAGGETTIRM